MKVCFASNYINHHQIPFSDALYTLLDGEYVFIQTQPMDEERIQMGWMQQDFPKYVRFMYTEPEDCQAFIDEADVVIYGGVEDESYLQRRLKSGKPIFRYSERLYREGQWKAVSPRGLRRKFLDHTRYRKSDVYLLCSGAYVPSDFHIIRSYPNKMMRWGYFPQTVRYESEQVLMERKRGNRLLWAARYLPLKHPEIPLRVARYLKQQGCDFHMDIIGGGVLEAEVQKLHKEYQLADVVTLHDFMSPAEVRNYMEQADIFLMTSDRREGWGAVVNEAMNSGCAVIGNHMIGAMPYLIEPGRNGYIYKDGQEQMICEQVSELLNNRQLCKQIGVQAYRTILQDWNSEEAAQRFTAMCVKRGFFSLDLESKELSATVREYLQSEEAFFSQGPGSAAPIISERKMFSYLHRDRGGEHI